MSEKDYRALDVLMGADEEKIFKTFGKPHRPLNSVKLYKGKFAPTQETINTRGESLEYQIPRLEGSFVARESDGAWKKVHDFLKNSPTDVWYQNMD